jgi:hypothetical protein
LATFSVEVSFSQLAVFASSLLNPFNDWLDRQVEQGFAWRPGSVSFRSIAEGGLHTVELRAVDHMGRLDPQATRAIEVPFDVPDDGAIEVGSITATSPLSLPSGS